MKTTYSSKFLLFAIALPLLTFAADPTPVEDTLPVEDTSLSDAVIEKTSSSSTIDPNSCPELSSWHFAYEVLSSRSYTERHCDLVVADELPTNKWILKIRLPALSPFIEKKDSISIWSNRYDMRNFTWKPVYDDASSIIDQLLSQAILTAESTKGTTKTCEYAAVYEGVDVRMYAYLETEKDDVLIGDE